MPEGMTRLVVPGRDHEQISRTLPALVQAIRPLWGN